MTTLLGYLKDEQGNSAAEYAVILAVIGLGTVLAASALSDGIAAGFQRAADNVLAAQQ